MVNSEFLQTSYITVPRFSSSIVPLISVSDLCLHVLWSYCISKTRGILLPGNLACMCMGSNPECRSCHVKDKANPWVMSMWHDAGGKKFSKLSSIHPIQSYLWILQTATCRPSFLTTSFSRNKTQVLTVLWWPPTNNNSLCYWRVLVPITRLG